MINTQPEVGSRNAATKTNVWVVLNGEHCEGGTVVGVFSSRQRAKTRALKCEARFDDWKQAKDPDDPNEWESGCDFVRIEQHEVNQ